MERIRFGTTDLEVSPIVLGTWVTGGWAWGGADEEDSLAALLRAFNRGINFVDTAPVYGFGRSESIVGEAIRQWGRRDELVIATKCCLDWDEKERITRNARPQRILKEIDDSLTRLGIDTIDLFQIHWPDSSTPPEESMATLVKLQEAGKIRYIGLSNFSVDQVKACMPHGAVASLQPPFNLFEREAEREILPFCHENGIATLAYGGLCRGMLTGKFTGDEQFPRGDLRRGDPKFKPDRFKQYVKAVDDLKKIAAGYGKTVAQLALRWALHQPGITTVIAGARTAAQVEDNVGVSGWQISLEDLARIDAIVLKHVKTPIGPEFMAPRP